MSDPAASDPRPNKSTRNVRTLLMAAGKNFSKAEMLVVRELLANYPAAGLTTISKLATLSGVSDPTVLRVATRLGFAGFSDLQQALLEEVEAHMRSPLTLAMSDVRRIHKKSGNDIQDFLHDARLLVQAVCNETATADYERAIAMITDRRSRVAFLGGRFSRHIAAIMQKSINHIREGTFLIEGTRADALDELAEFGRRHALVVFDYRRYQTDTVSFARQAKQRGTQILLFTDRWKSPIAEFADVTLTAPTESTSPFDTLVTPLLQVEAVITGLAANFGEDWRERASLLEQVRNENQVTLNDPTRSTKRPRTRTNT